ncbi:MAG: right-handed parallel beta-helix repeat-containing protein [Prevotella sp.]|nr:right-handed parallel beta-helix repeat-containing protein [Prevotella sp.]
MYIRTTIIALLSAFFLVLPVSAKDYYITDYGARKSTKKVNTQAIQKAIDECHKNRGGRVVVPRGKFLTGAIVLKSNVTLHLEEGAVLLGSKNPADYVITARQKGVMITAQLIFAAHANNIGITGNGTIDGQGKGFTDQACNALGITRPMLIRFDTCKGVKISGVTMRNSGVWMQLYHGCEDMEIKGITVYNHCNNCNDGIDINGCQNVTVSGITVDSDDDGICLKNVILKPCRNIVVENCTVSSHCNALKIGTETLGDFDNIVFRHCTVKPCKPKKVFNGRRNGISAIAIESVDGASVTNVHVSDITVDGTEVPIFVRLGNCGNTFNQKLTTPKKSRISGVTIENVTVTNAGNTGCSITGIPGQEVENVRLSNITISHGGGMGNVASPTDDRATAYPEGTMFGTLPAKGFYVKHTHNVTFDNVKIVTTRPDDRPALVKEKTR